eukprot:g2176.t1
MMPRTDPQSWEELASAVATTSPRAIIHLDVHFMMGNYTGEIHFSGKQLVIWGNNATLDSQWKGRFFSSSAGPNDDGDHGPAGETSLELHDLVMQNGRSDEYGGAVFVQGSVTLVIQNSKFEGEYGNTANSGGAVASGWLPTDEGANVEIHACTFQQNGASRRGGAIYILSPGSLSISDTTFKSNSAEYGGAIEIEGGTVTIQACFFQGSSASQVGGAIFQGPGSGDLKIFRSTFEQNQASSGGAVWGGATITISSTTFDSNTAGVGSEPPFAWSGGAILITGTLLVENTTFANNTFTDERPPDVPCCAGGAIYFVSNANGTLTGCTFIAGENKTKAGHDVARADSTSNVLFVCANTQCGDDFPMRNPRTRSVKLKSRQPLTPFTAAPRARMDGSILAMMAGIHLRIRARGSIPSGTIFTIKGLLEVNFATEASEHYKGGLTGTLPGDIRSASQLEKLTLNGNSLAGTIPDLSKLTSLKLIDLHYNKLSGLLPTLSSADITYISFAGNSFTGTIPSGWSALKKLGILGLADNKLSGRADIIAQFPSLVVVFLRNNSFVGEIPKLPVNTSVADFDHNKFTSVAADICNSTETPPTFDQPCGCKSDYPKQPFDTCCFANNSLEHDPSKPC